MLIVDCVIAILLAKELCGQMKVLLINIFAGEVCTWLSLALFCMEFTIVAQEEMTDILCGMLYYVATLQN